jgi:hypothetical protein
LLPHLRFLRFVPFRQCRVLAWFLNRRWILSSSSLFVWTTRRIVPFCRTGVRR